VLRAVAHAGLFAIYCRSCHELLQTALRAREQAACSGDVPAVPFLVGCFEVQKTLRTPVLLLHQVAEIEAAEKQKMREKCEKIIQHGINCFINRQLIYNYPEEIFADAGERTWRVAGPRHRSWRLTLSPCLSCIVNAGFRLADFLFGKDGVSELCCVICGARGMVT